MLSTIVTNDGLSNSIVAQNEEGFFIKIKSFGVSDIAGDLDASRTTPNVEWYNGLIAYGKQINSNTIEIMCTIPPNTVGVDTNIEELYLYGEDNEDPANTFLLTISQPDPVQLYTPTAELSFKVQVTIRNLDVSSVYQFIYTQATEIASHNEDPNAHPIIQSKLQQHGVFIQEIDREWTGQTVDTFIETKLDAAVVSGDAVYWDTTDSKYKKAIQDSSEAETVEGIYLETYKSIVGGGIINYTHSLSAFTNVYLSKTVLGAISTDYSNIMIGQALPNNRLLVNIKDIVKYGSVMGGSGGSGSFLPIMGDVSPIEAYEDGLDLLDFDSKSSQDIYFNFKIPEGYVAGNRLVLAGGVFYCTNVTAGKILFKAETALLKKGVHVFGVYDLVYDSTNVEVDASSTLGEQTSIGDIDLTDAIGQIGSTDVESGDILRIKVYRDIDSETTSADDNARMPRTCFEPKKVLI